MLYNHSEDQRGKKKHLQFSSMSRQMYRNINGSNVYNKKKKKIIQISLSEKTNKFGIFSFSI